MECLKALDLKDIPTGPGVAVLNRFRMAKLLDISVLEYDALDRAEAEALIMVALHDQEVVKAEYQLTNDLRSAARA